MKTSTVQSERDYMHVLSTVKRALSYYCNPGEHTNAAIQTSRHPLTQKYYLKKVHLNLGQQRLCQTSRLCSCEHTDNAAIWQLVAQSSLWMYHFEHLGSIGPSFADKDRHSTWMVLEERRGINDYISNYYPAIRCGAMF